MIVIDKSKENSRLIVTVTESSSNSESNYRLDVNSAFSNKSYSITLPENTSIFKERYDEFILDNSLFNEWEDGFYNYTITEINAGIVEVGSLKVFDSTTANLFISITKTEDEDDFIIYKSN